MSRTYAIAATLLAALVSLSIASPSRAHDYTIGQLHIAHPWSRATPPGSKVAGGFLKIENKGTTVDRLIGGTFPAAGRFEIHTMAMAGGVMTMRHLDKGLEIPPGQTIELKPGSYHLMFMDLATGITEGKRIKGTLVFEKAGTIEIDYKIEPIGAKSSGEGAAGTGHDMTGHDMTGHSMTGHSTTGHGTMDHGAGHGTPATAVKKP